MLPEDDMRYRLTNMNNNSEDLRDDSQRKRKFSEKTNSEGKI